MTELQTFAQKVQEVRKLQKDYFACRAPSTLSKCKKLERELDKEIEQILNPKTMRQESLM